MVVILVAHGRQFLSKDDSIVILSEDDSLIYYLLLFTIVIISEDDSIVILSEDDIIVIIKPDKANGIVILNKNGYLSKMETILQDSTKFKHLTDDWFKIIIRHEDKVIRFLQKLITDKLLNDDQYNFMYPTGSRPGILYGIPKVHKQNVALRAILSAIGTCGYKLSKFLLPFVEPITTNEFAVKDSFSFVEELKGLQNCGNYAMASFDIKSLFYECTIR